MKWNLNTCKIKDLKPYQANPRQLSKEQYSHLSKSIEKFGLIDKPIANIDGTLIGGHQRLKILQKQGVKEVEVYMPEEQLNEQDLKELNIRLNKNVGEWDFDILANQWETQDLLEWGFTEAELNFEVDHIESLEEDEGELVPPKNPITQLGDIYQLGDHRLICGDATNPDDVMKVLDGNEPILMVTDPPYGVSYEPEWRKNIKGKDGVGVIAMGKVQNDDQVNWSLAYSLFPGSVAYVWCASWFLPEVSKDLDDNNFERKSLIIWVKQHFVLSRGDYHWQHETCWYIVKKGHKHNWQGSRKETTVWEIANLNCCGKSKEDERTDHSTQKPLECMRKPILNNTSKGEGVYDPFCGSGTTLIAAEATQRICYGIELDPAYCDMIVDRWKRFRVKNNLDAPVIKNGREERT